MALQATALVKGISPEETAFLAYIGATLLVVQSAEQIFRFILSHVLIGDTPLSLEELEENNRTLQKKTLGQFIGILRERSGIAEEFDSALQTFLTNRNMLAHKLNEVPGWDRSTFEGRKAALAFLGETSASATLVSNVLIGLARQWEAQNKFDIKLSPEQQALFKVLDEKYTTTVGAIFFKKPPV